MFREQNVRNVAKMLYANQQTRLSQDSKSIDLGNLSGFILNILFVKTA